MTLRQPSTLKHLLILVICTITTWHISAQDGWDMNGTCIWQGDECFQLTTNMNTQNGSVWNETQLNLNEPFEMSFVMYFGNNNGGADGMCFVLHRDGLNTFGTGGGGVGYEGIGAITGSVAVEFDTWQNTQYGDMVNDHVGIVSNGNPSHIGATALSDDVQASATSTNIEDGQDHFVEINWDPETFDLSVYFDCELRVSSDTDIINEIFDGDSLVWWGFTGSTGGANNVQSFCVYEPESLNNVEYTICDGGSAVLDIGGNPDGGYQWSPEEGLSDATAPNPTATPTETTVYTVDYADFCDNSVTAEVTVNVEELDLNIEGPTVITCIDIQLPLVVTANPLFDLSYEWSTDGGVILGNYFGPEVLALTDGTYSIAVSAGEACSGTFDLVVTEDTEEYEVTVEEPGDIDCYGNGLNLVGTSSGSDGVAVWSTDNGDIVSGENSLIANVSTTGDYTLTVTNPNNGCESSVTVEVNGDTQAPDVYAGEADSLSCANPIINIFGANTNVGNYTASWTTSDGSIVSGGNSLSPAIDAPGLYTLTITDQSNGCSGSDDILIYQSEEGIVDLSSLEMPNIITPNEDLINDWFYPYLPEQPEFDVTSVMDEVTLTVFNRWGNPVFEWSPGEEPWNGEDDGGSDLPEGTYYVVLEYKINCGEGSEGSFARYVYLARD